MAQELRGKEFQCEELRKACQEAERSIAFPAGLKEPISQGGFRREKPWACGRAGMTSPQESAPMPGSKASGAAILGKLESSHLTKRLALPLSLPV